MVIRGAKGKHDPYSQVFINGKKEREHVAIAEKALGKPLPKGAEIHHINENKKDNRPDNLVICPSRAYHFLLHRRQRAFDATGHADWLWCSTCQSFDAPENLLISPQKGNRLKVIHRQCKRDTDARHRTKKRAA